MLRRLLEQTNGEVQQIVIDLEGEFYTLREEFDNYLLIGQGGDIHADLRAAGMLATKLREIKASAIIDLSELKFHERKRFVKLFLESLIDAPKELWTPCMVVLDEAHHFCPQVGESEATGAVIDLMTRGRKRKLCGVLATQRVSKLHKDAIAECNNKLFGRTAQDIDVKRTADELGFAKSHREAFETLRNLEAGEFFAFGTAIGSNVERYKIGEVRSTHQPTGKRGKVVKPVPPKAAIKQIVAKLADLPQEAEQKAKTEAEYRKEIGTLKAQITTLERRPQAAVVDEKAVAAAELRGRQQAGKEWEKVVKGWGEYAKRLRKVIADVMIAGNEAGNFGTPPVLPTNWLTPSNLEPATKVLPPKRYGVDKMEQTSYRPKLEIHRVETLNPDGTATEVVLKKGARRMLQVLVQKHPMKFTRKQWATLSDISSKSGTFSSYLSALRLGGFVEEEGDLVGASAIGIAYIGADIPQLQTSEEVRAMWRGKLKQGARRMFDVLEFHTMQGGTGISRDYLAEQAEISVNSGTFSSYLSALRRNELLVEEGGLLKLADDLFF